MQRDIRKAFPKCYEPNTKVIQFNRINRIIIVISTKGVLCDCDKMFHSLSLEQLTLTCADSDFLAWAEMIISLTIILNQIKNTLNLINRAAQF